VPEYLQPQYYGGNPYCDLVPDWLAFEILRDKMNSCLAREKQKDVEIALLKNEVETLKKKVASLSKNSSTSSKSPSSDIVKKIKKKKGGKKNKIGGQKGHKRHERKPFKPEEVDNWYLYTLNGCPECESELRLCPEKTQTIQQVEVKEVPIDISDHRAFAYWCPKCGKFHYAPMPDDVKKAGLCGPTFTALIAYLKSALHASFTTIRKFVRDVLKITICRSQLSKLIDKVGLALNAPYDELLKKIPLEQKLNVDETGHKNNGERFWTWCFRAELYVLFKIDKSRGSQVLIEVLGEEFNGVIGCDYFSAYRKFIKDFNVSVQFCLAHLIRDIRFLITLPSKEEKEYGRKLLAQMRRMFKLIHDNDDKPREFIEKELKEIRADFLRIGIEEVPLKYDKNGKLVKTKSRNLANRFIKHGEAFFQFITTPQIDPTNNIAEQAIRFVVIDRYITQGTRSEKGRRNCERLWTVLATCGTTGRSAFYFIKSAVNAYFNKGSPPSLLEPASG
jgi:transposase